MWLIVQLFCLVKLSTGRSSFQEGDIAIDVPDPEYVALENAPGCIDQDSITSTEECKTAAASLGFNNDEIETVSWGRKGQDGTWLEWTPWSRCSKHCVGKDGLLGSITRSRLCSQPRNGGLPCEENGYKQSKLCPFKDDEIVRCPEDFSWNNWSKWSDCSLSCGGGTIAKLRSCKDGQYGGRTCPKAQERMVIPCNNQACPDCILAEWGIWSSCSQDCLNTTLAIPVTGIRHKSRKHSEADPDKPVCNPKDFNQKESCNTQPCPVDFAWSTWTSWSTCYPECGNGKSSRTRFCNEGRHGGNVCPSPQQKQEESCKIKNCPECILLDWEDWSSCTMTCYDSEDPDATLGTKTRKRIYSEADPSNPKCNEIENLLSQTETCNSHHCPVNSKWAEWTSWSTCSTSCDNTEEGVMGKKERLRTCIEGQYGGTTCPPVQGKNSESLSCNNAKCPVDGEWESWSPWGSCSKDCVGEDGVFGQRKRERKCKPPKYSGKSCDSEGFTQEEACPYKEGNQEFIKCKIDSRWGEWTAYSECSTTCGTGEKTKRRVCLEGLHGGSACPPIHGEHFQTDQCFLKECAVDGEWESWLTWGSCSKDCVGEDGVFGQRKRERKCKPPKYSGKSCDSKGYTQKEACNTRQCPVNAKWDEWTNWSPCSTSCDRIEEGVVGKKERLRACVDGQYGGTTCPPAEGNNSESLSCENDECPVDCEWSEWGDWKKCSKGCGGGGQKTRTRYITKAARHGGVECKDGGKIEKQACFEMACPPCEKGDWTSWTNDPCPKGYGHTQERSRPFISPKDWAAIDCSTQHDERQSKHCEHDPWREDLRCGEDYPASNGQAAQCDPKGPYPCCSEYGWCGDTDGHCYCNSCVNYAVTLSSKNTVYTPGSHSSLLWISRQGLQYGKRVIHWYLK